MAEADVTEVKRCAACHRPRDNNHETHCPICLLERNVAGESESDPRLANLVNPVDSLVINGMRIDMRKFKEAADRLGADKHDVLSIGGYRNAKGELVPDYDSVRIERRDGK